LTDFVDLQYRFRRNAEHDEYMKFLINDSKLFNQYKDVMMLSSLVGYENGLHIEFNKTAQDRVLMNFFDSEDLVLIDLIAYAHSKDQNIISNRAKYTIFENYYNGGFPILLKLLDLTEDKLSIKEESYYKELSIKLYRIITNYKITPRENIDIY
jgi:dnd system-associated protein 4